MKIKTIGLLLLVVVMAVSGLAVVAQEDAEPTEDPTTAEDGRRGRGEGFRPGRGDFDGRGAPMLRELVDIVAAETGLEAEDIADQLREGTTITEIIEANGGNVTVVTEALGGLMLERFEQQMAMGGRGEGLRERFEGRGTALLAGRTLMNAIEEETGLTPRDVMDAMRDGDATLAEVIAENDGDADAVITAALATASEMASEAVANERLTQEEADDLLANIEAWYTDALNGELRLPSPPRSRGQQLNEGIVRSAAEQLEMDPRDLIEEIRAGQSLAEVLSANDIDADEFIAEMTAQAEERLSAQVEAGRMTQESADALLEVMTDTLSERLNYVPGNIARPE